MLDSAPSERLAASSILIQRHLTACSICDLEPWSTLICLAILNRGTEAI